MLPSSQSQQPLSSPLPSSSPKQTIQSIVNGISFISKSQKYKKNNGTYSQSYNNQSQISPIYNNNDQSMSISISSQGSYQKVEKSKLWTEQEEQLFKKLLQKYGTDFNFIKGYFPKKSKNQIKNKYKQLSSAQKKIKKSEYKIKKYDKDNQKMESMEDQCENIYLRKKEEQLASIKQNDLEIDQCFNLGDIQFGLDFISDGKQKRQK